MPNRSTHTFVGSIAGGVAVARVTRDKTDKEKLISVIGGLIGGNIGGRLPDIIDPPTGPNHRGVGHSATLGLAGSGGYAYKVAPLAMEYCYEQAAIAEENGDFLLEILWLFLAGLVWGIGAGYASHLLLDLGTPKGLPL